MAVNKVTTNGETCPFCEKQVAYVYKGTNLKTVVWYCPECFSVWGNAGSSEEAQTLLECLSPIDS